MRESISYPLISEITHPPAILWSGFLNGNQKALSGLYHSYYTRLFEYGLRLVRNEELIKDSIQELFLYMWEHRSSINEVRSVKAYLFLSLRRSIFVQLRREKSRYQRNKQYVEDFLDDRKNIEDILVALDESNAQSEQIRRAYTYLSERQQEVIQLKYFDGLTTAEICKLLGLKRQSVYNCLSEAIARLQKCVECYN